MAISKMIVLLLFVVSATAWSRETASPSSCQSAAAQPTIASAKAALGRTPANLGARFGLADAFSDAGCFNEAVKVLESAPQVYAGNKELQMRLRVARSLVGEEIYFDKLDRADAEAKLKRDTFRCTTLSDLDACSEAVRIKPDDAPLLIAQADALARAKRPVEAIGRYRRAAALVPNEPDIAGKIRALEAQLAPLQPSAPPARVAHVPPSKTAIRQYSNAEPVARSH